MKDHALTLREGHQRIGDGHHAAVGNEGAKAELQVGNHAQGARRLVGRRAVVGGKSIKNLNGLGGAEPFCMHPVHGLGQLKAGQGRQGRQGLEPQIGRSLVQGTL